MLLLRSCLLCAGGFLDIDHKLVFRLFLVDRPGGVVDLITINIEGVRTSPCRPEIKLLYVVSIDLFPTYMFAQ